MCKLSGWTNNPYAKPRPPTSLNFNCPYLNIVKIVEKKQIVCFILPLNLLCTKNVYRMYTYGVIRYSLYKNKLSCENSAKDYARMIG